MCEQWEVLLTQKSATFEGVLKIPQLPNILLWRRLLCDQERFARNLHNNLKDHQASCNPAPP